MALLSPAADNAWYRANLVRFNGSNVAESAAGSVDLKVHAVRDASGGVLRGYVDFSLQLPLAAGATISELAILRGSVDGSIAMTVDASHLPKDLGGRNRFQSSARVLPGDEVGLETLQALVDGSNQFYVSLTTSSMTLRGQMQRTPDPLVETRSSQDGVWKEVDENALALKPEMRAGAPRFYRTFQLDQNAFASVLRSAPMEFTPAAKTSAALVSLPMPDGQFSRFRIEESPVMEPALASKVPEFKTYRGQGIDDRSATMRLGWSPQGLDAVILLPHETVYVSRASQGDKARYMSYYKRDVPANQFQINGRGNDAIHLAPQESLNRSIAQSLAKAPIATGDMLRTYRLAIATTKGFTEDSFYGGGGDGVPARMTTLMNLGKFVNLINALYERDVTVHLTLIANELNAIFDATSNPDPGYTDGDENALLNQNQGFLDTAVGNGNYDIGHVLGLTNPGSGAGLGAVGVVCSATNKAQGSGLLGVGKVTGNYNADAQLIEHEMAHQFNAEHTTNSTAGFCMTERNPPTAYETGSGSTILANAGSCDPENLQGNTDNYFHGNTIDEIDGYVAGAGNCFVASATNNTIPTVTAPANMTIPMATPFTLTAVGSDPDGDMLTYNWEEFDLGTASPPLTDDGTRPLFRTVLPNASPSRTFPNMTYVLNNANQPPATIPCPDDNTMTCVPGETLPVTARTMNFRVTVRDNHAGGGGVNNATTQVTTTTGAGPFQVTQPNTAITWQTNSAQTVTWNVANTNAAPVNAANVSILLSTDGGNTFPTVLLQSTPNTGSAMVTVPEAPTATARVMVAAVGNIFFDVSDVNFAIADPNMTMLTINTAMNNNMNSEMDLANALNPTNNSPCPTAQNPFCPTFMVDGVKYSGTHSFAFTEGSTHTVSTPAMQTSPGTRNQFNHWSDGGGMTHTIKASRGTLVYTAYYDTQYQLLTGVAPPGTGTVTPPSGDFFPAESLVDVSATPAQGYTFDYWKGLPPPSGFPHVESPGPRFQLKMTRPFNLTANFCVVSSHAKEHCQSE